jgi:hypothetical protein
MADESQMIGSRDALICDTLLLAFVAFWTKDKGCDRDSNDGIQPHCAHVIVHILPSATLATKYLSLAMMRLGLQVILFSSW